MEPSLRKWRRSDRYAFLVEPEPAEADRPPIAAVPERGAAAKPGRRYVSALAWRVRVLRQLVARSLELRLLFSDRGLAPESVECHPLQERRHQHLHRSLEPPDRCSAVDV